MLLVRRIVRRVKGLLWTLWYYFLAPFKWLRVKKLMRQNGLSEKYLWESFSYLAGLDMREPMLADDGLQIYGAGFFLEMKDQSREFHATIQQNWKGQLIVQLWRPEERLVPMEFGYQVKTHWWEVYRSGTSVDPSALALVMVALRRLYGDGPAKEAA